MIVSISLCNALLAQTSLRLDFHLSDKYFDIDFPKEWQYESYGGAILNLKLPNTSPNLNPYILVRCSSEYGAEIPIFMKAMKEYMFYLEYPGSEELIKKLGVRKDSLGGLKGYLLDSDDLSNVQRDYYLRYDETTMFYITVRCKKELYQEYVATIEGILSSLRFHPINLPKNKWIPIETTEEEIDQWIKTPADLQRMPKNKLDSLLHEMENGNVYFKLKDSGLEIKNWATFFQWKASSSLRDYSLFAYSNWAKWHIDVFARYLHLGDYDSLFIASTGGNKLNLKFIKNGVVMVQWDAIFQGSHNLPLNQQIPLNRFLVYNSESYSSPLGGEGVVTHWLLNDAVYHLKIDAIDVR
ncbi:MAG: hypothetical protein GC192_17570 [Bacteroidetes bacterium]|nr:hypothetical protein [Bacteroidota bacterium]